MKSKISAALLSLTIVLGFSSSAQALSISDIVHSVTKTNAEADAQSNTEVEVGNGVLGSSSGSVNVEAENQNQSASGDDTAVSSDASKGTQASEETNTLVITREDVELNGVSPTQISVSAITGETDLSGYVAAQIKADKNVSTVETSESGVEVTYDTPAKLFGIFPMTVQTTVNVDADGTVNVSYPWYGFLLSTEGGDLETQLQTVVKTELSAAAGKSAVMASADVQADVETAVGMTSATQAKLISGIRAVLQAVSETQVNAEASANANASVQ